MSPKLAGRQDSVDTQDAIRMRWLRDHEQNHNQVAPADESTEVLDWLGPAFSLVPYSPREQYREDYYVSYTPMERGRTYRRFKYNTFIVRGLRKALHGYVFSLVEQKPHEEPAHDASAEKIFRESLDEWTRDTLIESSTTRIISHPAYLRIIGLGEEALSFIFEELQKNRGHWTAALRAITGENPTSPGDSFRQSVDAWLKWGREHSYLK